MRGTYVLIRHYIPHRRAVLTGTLCGTGGTKRRYSTALHLAMESGELSIVQRGYYFPKSSRVFHLTYTSGRLLRD